MGDHSSRRPVARTLKQSTRTAGPEPALSYLVPSLFDLAPGGVCRAASVTVRAVRSYRTLSPFAGPKPLAVCSLWHFPLLRLPEAAGRYPAPWFPWSPDFPPPLARRRSPDPLALCGYSANERRLRAIARAAEVGWGADLLDKAPAKLSLYHISYMHVEAAGSRRHIPYPKTESKIARPAETSRQPRNR